MFFQVRKSPFRAEQQIDGKDDDDDVEIIIPDLVPDKTILDKTPPMPNQDQIRANKDQLKANQDPLKGNKDQVNANKYPTGFFINKDPLKAKDDQKKANDNGDDDDVEIILPDNDEAETPGMVARWL